VSVGVGVRACFWRGGKDEEEELLHMRD
jgi:hypothetical protein